MVEAAAIESPPVKSSVIHHRDRTAIDIALFAVRLFAGIIFAAHGAQKMFGIWDGPGLEAMYGYMGVLGVLVSIGEFFGGLGLIVGFLSRFSAASLIVIMIGAIAMAHGQNGFFLGKTPETTMAESGFEYNFALIGLMLPTLIAGPGRYAVARFLPIRGTAARVIE